MATRDGDTDSDGDSDCTTREARSPHDARSAEPRTNEHHTPTREARSPHDTRSVEPHAFVRPRRLPRARSAPHSCAKRNARRPVRSPSDGGRPAALV